MSTRPTKIWPSAGSKALKSKLAEHGGLTGVAVHLGVGKDVVSRWTNGKRKPDPRQRAAIEDRFGIPWRDWDVPLTGGHEVAHVP